MTPMILYAGYGANREVGMIAAIIGAPPKTRGNVIICDVELCVQRFDQIPSKVTKSAPLPVSPRKMVSEYWSKNSGFETYTIRPKRGKSVSATLFELTPTERALIADWELIEFGWYKRMKVNVRLEDGHIIEAETEGLGTGGEIDRAIYGIDYKNYLNNPTDMLKAAEKSRREYFERSG